MEQTTRSVLHESAARLRKQLYREQLSQCLPKCQFKILVVWLVVRYWWFGCADVNECQNFLFGCQLIAVEKCKVFC